MNKRMLLRILAAATLAASALGVGAQTQAPAPAPSPTAVKDYVLGPGDQIKVTVFQSPELSLETRIPESGTVSFPLLGPVTLGWTYFNGVRDDNDTGAQLYNRIIDNTFKIGYDTGKWNFQAFLSAEKVDWKTPLANYHVLTGDFAGDTFHTVEIKRQRADLWALYDLGSGTRTYVRLDLIGKKWQSDELAGYSSKMNVSKIEGGWLITF